MLDRTRQSVEKQNFELFRVCLIKLRYRGFERKEEKYALKMRAIISA